MRTRTRKGIRLYLLAFVVPWIFAFPALAGPGDHGLEKEVEGVTVELVFKELPVKTGSNKLTVRLTDSNHNPLQDAIVQVALVISTEGGDAHAGDDPHAGDDKDDHSTAKEGGDSHSESGSHSEPVVARLKPGHDIGEYEGTISILEEGEWSIIVNFIEQNREKEVEFTVDVVRGTGPWLLLTGFFSVNIAIIATAAVLKKRQHIKMT